MAFKSATSIKAGERSWRKRLDNEVLAATRVGGAIPTAHYLCWTALNFYTKILWQQHTNSERIIGVHK